MDGIRSRWTVGRHMNELMDEGSMDGWVKREGQVCVRWREAVRELLDG